MEDNLATLLQCIHVTPVAHVSSCPHMSMAGPKPCGSCICCLAVVLLGCPHCYSLGKIREQDSAHYRLLAMFPFMRRGCESPRLVGPSSWVGQDPGFYRSAEQRGHTQGTLCDHRVREGRSGRGG